MATYNPDLPHQELEVDFCVVGGGMAGICAAVSAARHGARVALMHERPMLGGNASSECRVHVQGAGQTYLRETGILEELRLDNLACNPQQSYSLWDLVLYEKVKAEANITLLLNCSCLDASMDNNRIRSVTGWQLTTQTYHTVKAKIFADCSGDGILAPLTNAEYRVGREARNEYNESIAPETADKRTMGMTCLFMSREHSTPQPFTPPQWARTFESAAEIPYGDPTRRWWEMGYWWVELGGEYDSIHDTEMLRDELLKITLGVWDFIKNRSPEREKTANWALDWLQFLPGKRESRRYLGDHVLNQNDIESEGRFDDLVAYGGWSMDDHHPAGFEAVKIGAPATIFHPAPSPYGITYRCLYSRNIDNLMFAGRCHSATHAAMSSTRVMGTGCSMGQAVGTAAGMAVSRGLMPRDICGHIAELQQTLIRDDCYLPWVEFQHPQLTRDSRLEATHGDPEPVRDPFFRQIGEESHAWIARPGDSLTYNFPSATEVSKAWLTLDSAMDRNIIMSHHQRDDHLSRLPDVLPRSFRIEGMLDGEWETLSRVEDNHQRHVNLPVNRRLSALRWTLEQTRGADECRVYGFVVE